MNYFLTRIVGVDNWNDFLLWVHAVLYNFSMGKWKTMFVSICFGPYGLVCVNAYLSWYSSCYLICYFLSRMCNYCSFHQIDTFILHDYHFYVRIPTIMEVVDRATEKSSSKASAASVGLLTRDGRLNMTISLFYFLWTKWEKGCNVTNHLKE